MSRESNIEALAMKCEMLKNCQDYLEQENKILKEDIENSKIDN